MRLPPLFFLSTLIRALYFLCPVSAFWAFPVLSSSNFRGLATRGPLSVFLLLFEFPLRLGLSFFFVAAFCFPVVWVYYTRRALFPKGPMHGQMRGSCPGIPPFSPVLTLPPLFSSLFYLSTPFPCFFLRSLMRVERPFQISRLRSLKEQRCLSSAFSRRPPPASFSFSFSHPPPFRPPRLSPFFSVAFETKCLTLP